MLAVAEVFEKLSDYLKGMSTPLWVRFILLIHMALWFPLLCTQDSGILLGYLWSHITIIRNLTRKVTGKEAHKARNKDG